MPIQYVDPLRRAWERMRSMLFRPFNLEVWMVMGFTAWLARLWDNAGMGGGNKWRNGINVDQDDTDFILRRGADRWEVGDFDRWGQADSLFLWRLAVQVLAGIVTIAFILPALFLVIPIAEGGLWRGIGVFGAVIMLPVYVTGRVLGPEYLGQFGGEYGLWDDDAVIDESAEPAPPVDEIE